MKGNLLCKLVADLIISTICLLCYVTLPHDQVLSKIHNANISTP